MRRREFIAGLGGAAAWQMVAQGQEASRVHVGFVDFAGENDPNGTDRARACGFAAASRAGDPPLESRPQGSRAGVLLQPRLPLRKAPADAGAQEHHALGLIS
jgi:hypothetical protein